MPLTGAGWCSLAGFQQEFETLALAIKAGTARQARKAASTTEFDAALLLHERSEELKHKVRFGKSVADQLVQVAAAHPRKYRASTLRSRVRGVKRFLFWFGSAP